jgi:hypothetical protein
MTQENYEWLLENKTLLYNSIRMTKDQSLKIFEIYNTLVSIPMKYTTCNSCVRTVIRLLKQEFEKYTIQK